MTARSFELLLLWSLSAVAVLAGSLCAFGFVRKRSSMILPPLHIRAVPWGAGLCLLAFAILWLPQQELVRWFVEKDADRIARIPALLKATAVSFPLQIASLLTLIYLVAGSFLTLGITSFRRAMRDAMIGFAAWLVATPILLALQTVVRYVTIQLLELPPIEHKLIEALSKDRNDWFMWSLVALEAVLMAPVREELFFRGCLQSWLTRRIWGGTLAVGLALIAPFVLTTPDTPNATMLACSAFVAVMAICLWSGQAGFERLASRWSYLFPRMTRGSGATFRGVVGTALLFAAFHAAAWPDPIALFLFGLVVGWLAWRTQGLVAPIVCHAMFNATSLMILRLSST